MNIKVVTDSTAALPPSLAAELGIVVVPAYVHIGSAVYRDRVDISEDEFYERLQRERAHPYTEPPTPPDFAEIYRKLAGEADAVVSIHISSRLSATCNSALRGKELAESEVPIEVIDSRLVTMGLGLLAIAAASHAASAEGLPQLVQMVKSTAPRIRMIGMFDTLEYLARGGRIGRARALFASLLNVKPLLTLKDGEVEPAGRVRNRSDGINALLRFARSYPEIEDLAVVYSTTPEEAQSLAGSLAPLVAGRPVRMARLGPVLGVHGGPGILFVVLRAAK